LTSNNKDNNKENNTNSKDNRIANEPNPGNNKDDKSNGNNSGPERWILFLGIALNDHWGGIFDIEVCTI
jgi:hypothetical protein